MKKTREQRGKQGGKARRHIKTLIMTPPIQLKKYQQDKFNNTKKCHKR
jgi:hypothetical protein